MPGVNTVLEEASAKPEGRANAVIGKATSLEDRCPGVSALKQGREILTWVISLVFHHIHLLRA